MRWILIVLGILMLLIGGVWTLQGINILLGSPMSGQPFWAVMGVLLAIVGAVLVYFGWRRGTAQSHM